jgi:hypothetical protein
MRVIEQCHDVQHVTGYQTTFSELVFKYKSQRFAELY